MASNDKSVPPHKTEAPSSAAEEKVTEVSALEKGLAGLTAGDIKEPGQIAEALQRAQLES